MYFNFYLGSFGLYLGTSFPVGFIPENTFFFLLQHCKYEVIYKTWMQTKWWLFHVGSHGGM